MRLRRNSPANTTSTSDSATCDATSERSSSRRRRPPTSRPEEAARREAVERSAGSSPNSRQVSTAAATVNPRTRASGVRSSGSRSAAGIATRSNATLPHHANARPSAPPKPASNADSVSSCRTIRDRPAPSARRVAIFSLARLRAREQQGSDVQAGEQHHCAEQRQQQPQPFFIAVSQTALHPARTGFDEQPRFARQALRIAANLFRRPCRPVQTYLYEDRTQILRGLLARDARFQPAHHLNPGVVRFVPRRVARGEQVARAHRDRHVAGRSHQRAEEPVRFHTDDCERNLVDQDARTDRRGVPPESCVANRRG